MFKYFFILSRVPVRKPGLNNGEIFKQPSMGLHQKTHSVPNLFHTANVSCVTSHSNHMVPLPPPPAPPPPPASSIPPPQSSHIYSSPSSNFNESNHSDASFTISNFKKNGFQNSASSDTLVQEESNECPVDYEASPEKLSAFIEPAVDYDQPKLSTFNQTKSPATQNGNNNLSSSSTSNLIVLLNRSNAAPSPLTPRQIKQRNVAKRGSIPCRSSSSTPTLNESFVATATTATFTQQQLTDLNFLQSQKFDADFIQTTQDLFSRYPNAKISISVTVSSFQTNPQSQQQIQTKQTTRQIEIDKAMFERINSLNQHAVAVQASSPDQLVAKIQPQTPVRTTSTLTTPTGLSASKYNSFSSLSSSNSPSSSSSSSSYSSSAYDSSVNIEHVNQVVDLKEEIRRAASEHVLKRQINFNATCIETNKTSQQPTAFSYKSNTKNM